MTHRKSISPNHTGPTGQDLDSTLGHLGAAHTALCGMRSLVHVHSTRHALVVSEDAVQYLLEKRDEVIAALDTALASYAHTVDPSGTLADIVANTLADIVAAELAAVDDDAVFGIRHMRRLPNGNVVQVRRYS